MKPAYFLVAVFISIISILCNTMPDASLPNVKDLDENMMDVRVYHENLGGALLAKDRDNAEWLLGGMDSLLHVISGKFVTHRKLDHPFEYFYSRELRSPIGDIREALEKNDFPKAVAAYTVLTRNCNGCHDDHDVDKEIRNWALPK
jgi:hypothetical protein